MSRFTELAARHGVRAAAVTAAVGATIALAPASQASASVRPASGCSPNIGYTHKSGSTIWAYGNLGSCNGSVSITIQRSRWFGWEDLSSGTITSHSDQYVGYNCGGTGTHTFRAIEIWYDWQGNAQTKASNSITTTC